MHASERVVTTVETRVPPHLIVRAAGAPRGSV
jgi:hypothetical protein